MFDIAFSELLIVAVVALVVIGPERLPKAARTLGHLFGRMQRYVNDVKADISREMELEELRKLQASMQDAARSFQSSVANEFHETDDAFRKLAGEVPTDGQSSAPAAGSSVAGRSQLELGLETAPPAERKPG